MLYTSLPSSNREEYEAMLKAVASLSRLFSDSDSPYLYYRVAENIYSRSFQANDLSRQDGAFDATLNQNGIGLKTFLHGNGKKFEKVAEFNAVSESLRSFIQDKKYLDLTNRICELRNKRINAATAINGVSSSIYHCVTRARAELKIYEGPYRKIDINSIETNKIVASGTSLEFSDGLENYRFNFSKSTLFKQFDFTAPPLRNIEVNILKDPFKELLKLYSAESSLKKPAVHRNIFQLSLNEDEDQAFRGEFVILPLYSTVSKSKEVQKKSGLNQWNAGGRDRNDDEVYISVPSWIHKRFPNFFPPRYQDFCLTRPDGMVMSARICQDSGKALMTNPNSVLGAWILRKILKIEPGELVKRSDLDEAGIDSIIIIKDGDDYSIDFLGLDAFEQFRSKYWP